MKISFFFLSALAGLILNIASSLLVRIPAKDGNSESERIVDGKKAVKGQFPWSAALFRNGRFLCTSSIIGNRTVLTAAHCVSSNNVTAPAQEFHAIANYDKTSSAVRLNFMNLTVHPNYNENNIVNDIAIFTTTEDIPFSDTVKPICIAHSDTDPMEYENVLAMGWGDTQRFRFVPVIPDILHYVEQDIASPAKCEKYYGSELEQSKICAGDTFSGICNGDSGGPLVFEDPATNTSVQIGIASYGHRFFGCGFLAPSVWTRVSYYTGFIINTTLTSPPEGDSSICII